MTHGRSQALRLFALVFAVVGALAIVLGALISSAQAAPGWKLTQHKVPTADSAPKHITEGSDGNLWFTEGQTFDVDSSFDVGKITPAGDITEFPVCDQCSAEDIVQGADSLPYFTSGNKVFGGLGRINTSGERQSDVVPPKSETARNQTISEGIAASGDDVWFTDRNNSIWRYDTGGLDGGFTQYLVPTTGANPHDVAVAPDGTVWFTEANAGKIGKLDPRDGTIKEIPVTSSPRQIAIATDNNDNNGDEKVWFTDRFNHAVGYIDRSNNDQFIQVSLPTSSAGPEDIAAAPDGSMWLTQGALGNVARIAPDGTITEEGKAIKDDPNSPHSSAFGITIGPDGQSVWYTMQADNKIAALEPPKQ